MSILKLTAAILMALPLAGCSKREGAAPPADTSITVAPVPVPLPAPTPPAATPSPVVDSLPVSPGAFVVKADEYNALKVGWPLARFNEAIGEQLKPKYAVSDQCDILHPARFPSGVTVMVVLDTIVRFDIDRTGILTSEGAGIGDSEARIKELYRGTVTVQPHKYTGPAGHYLVVTPKGDAQHRMIFETDGKKVLRYHVGRRPAVEYIEGCS